MLNSLNAVRPTRYPELGARKDSIGLWRVIDMETGAAIGPFYPTRGELLDDLSRFYAERFLPTADAAK